MWYRCRCDVKGNRVNIFFSIFLLKINGGYALEPLCSGDLKVVLMCTRNQCFNEKRTTL